MAIGRPLSFEGLVVLLLISGLAALVRAFLADNDNGAYDAEARRVRQKIRHHMEETHPPGGTPRRRPGRAQIGLLRILRVEPGGLLHHAFHRQGGPREEMLPGQQGAVQLPLGQRRGISV